MPESELKLLPCPFCGGHDIKIIEVDLAQCEIDYCIRCLDCETSNCLMDTKEECIRLWNTRAKDPEKEALREALDVCLSYFKIFTDDSHKQYVNTIEAALKVRGE
jgi:Lar family restriction alleviation protein